MILNLLDSDYVVLHYKTEAKEKGNVIVKTETDITASNNNDFNSETPENFNNNNINNNINQGELLSLTPTSEVIVGETKPVAQTNNFRSPVFDTKLAKKNKLAELNQAIDDKNKKSIDDNQSSKKQDLEEFDTPIENPFDINVSLKSNIGGDSEAIIKADKITVNIDDEIEMLRNENQLSSDNINQIPNNNAGSMQINNKNNKINACAIINLNNESNPFDSKIKKEKRFNLNLDKERSEELEYSNSMQLHSLIETQEDSKESDKFLNRFKLDKFPSSEGIKLIKILVLFIHIHEKIMLNLFRNIKQYISN